MPSWCAKTFLKGFIQGEGRTQDTLFPGTLDDLVPEPEPADGTGIALSFDQGGHFCLAEPHKTS
jgi:hypothetical protein